MSHAPTSTVVRGSGLSTHNVCVSCYRALEPGGRPHRVKDAKPETCCRCGSQNESGIYYVTRPGRFRFCTGQRRA